MLYFSVKCHLCCYERLEERWNSFVKDPLQTILKFILPKIIQYLAGFTKHQFCMTMTWWHFTMFIWCGIPVCFLSGTESKNLYHGCQIRLTCNLWKRICQHARLWQGAALCVMVLCVCLCDRQRRQVITEDNASGPELNSGRWRQTKRWCDRWKEVMENQRPAGEAVGAATCPLAVWQTAN